MQLTQNNLKLKKIIPKIKPAIRAVAIYLTIRIVACSAIYYVCIEHYTLADLISLLFPISFINVLLFFAICSLFYRIDITIHIYNRIASLIFAIAMVIGNCYKDVGNFIGVYRQMGALLIVSVYGFYVIFNFAFFEVKIIYQKLITFHFRQIEALVNSKIYLKSFVGIYLCWLPYIIIRYPAGIEYDAYYQIEQGMGLRPLAAHHPVLSSVIMGKIVYWGKQIFHSYNAGAFLFVLFQTTICIAVISYSLLVLHKLKAKPIVILGCFIAYAVVPIYPSFLTAIVKDSLFSIAVLLDITFLIQVFFGKGKSNGLVIAVGLTSLAVCMLRNNGVFIILFLFLAFSVSWKKKLIWSYKQVVLGLGMPIIIFIIYSSLLLPRLGIVSDAAQESFSLPYQQTARYLKYYPDDVSAEEIAIINRVLDAEYIAENYNPLLSDPVKDTYHGSTDDLKEYFKLWFKMFLRHPAVYVGATLHNSYAFFYPDLGRKESLGLYMITWNLSTIQYEKPEFLLPYCDGLTKYINLWEQCPLVYGIYNGGMHTWIAVWITIYAIANKKRKLFLISIPSMVTFLVCIASPGWWNNGFRYMLPIMLSNPVLLSLTSICKESKIHNG